MLKVNEKLSPTLRVPHVFLVWHLKVFAKPSLVMMVLKIRGRIKTNGMLKYYNKMQRVHRESVFFRLESKQLFIIIILAYTINQSVYLFVHVLPTVL